MASFFQQINALIEPSFWHSLSKKKLNDMMLDERPFASRAYFQAGRVTGVLSFAFLNEDSLTDLPAAPSLVSHHLRFPFDGPSGQHQADVPTDGQERHHGQSWRDDMLPYCKWRLGA
jgi:hypothetical protein